MSNLLGVSKELKVFKCPNCNEYISSNKENCPKCSFQITDYAKSLAIQTQDEEVKEANRKFYRTILYTGIGIFLIGGLMLLSSTVTMLSTGTLRIVIWSPFLTVLGLGQIFYGLNGLRKEK